MQPHERLALRIATGDLRYVSGSAISAATGEDLHPRVWPFTQWGAMVAYETQKYLGRNGGQSLELSWDPAIAEAARHSNKFFEDKGLEIDGVVRQFQLLLEANYDAYFPKGRDHGLDPLRNDLSVIVLDGELLLTNVSGFFMTGVPVEHASDLTAMGPHARRLAVGIGQATRALTGASVGQVFEHGNKDQTTPTWWDTKSYEALPNAFAGALDPPVAMAMLTLLSTVQSARYWARADCCSDCASAASKNRFVTLYQAVRSIERFWLEGHVKKQSTAQKCVEDILDATAESVLTHSLRRLRNGWLHLGLGNVAGLLPSDPTVGDVVLAYTGMTMSQLDELVDDGLVAFAKTMNAWALSPTPMGSNLTDYLVEPR